MKDIFISYSSADRAKVALLVQLLKEQGWSVWWDRTIPIGKSYAAVIEEALSTSKCVVVIWSKNSVTSDWVRTEADEGKERKVLVPVLFDEVKIPLEFKRIQSAQLFDWTGESTHPEIIKFLQSVSEILENPFIPPQDISQEENVKNPPRYLPSQRFPFSADSILIAGAMVALAIVLAFFIWNSLQTTQIGNNSVAVNDNKTNNIVQPSQNPTVNNKPGNFVSNNNVVKPDVSPVNTTNSSVNVDNDKKGILVRIYYKTNNIDAETLKNALIKEGYTISSSSPEKVDVKLAPNNQEVRYYYSEDRQKAERISQLGATIQLSLKPEDNSDRTSKSTKIYQKGEIRIYIN